MLACVHVSVSRSLLSSQADKKTAAKRATIFVHTRQPSIPSRSGDLMCSSCSCQEAGTASGLRGHESVSMPSTRDARTCPTYPRHHESSSSYGMQ